MTMKLREKTPVRTTEVEHQADYHAYREQLKEDFNCRCGYCDDRDVPRSASFEIDHFVPQKIDSTKETDYNNLVYACKSCNNAKRAKWPTGDKTRPNDGKKGWIDPCFKAYDAQFERSDDGRILPKTELGSWMYENLKLWKKQHEILWNYEKLEKNINELAALLDANKLPAEQKDNLILLYQKQCRILNSLYEA